MNLLTFRTFMSLLLSFMFFTSLVGVVTYWRTRKENLNSGKGYFLAGNSLSGWVIAGSLLLTNLSAANFTGMTAQVYGGNLAPIAWTVTVIPSLIFLAGVMLPTFLRRGFTTIPEFLENRYGPSTRKIVTGLFLFCYLVGGMPVALYGGALAIIHMFDVPVLLGLDEGTCVWIIVWALGLIGAVYALFGGLKGVAVSDTLNGIGLLIGGVLVFIFGLAAVGGGHFGAGAKTVFTTETWKLDAVGSQQDLVPFAVLFTGMVLHNLFFWCTNQFIVQRAFGARSLKEGQKGVMIAGFFKILNIFYIAFPGVIAYHLYGSGHFENNDWVYPTLVRDVMPDVFIGFFAAVIFGSVLSTYNSVLNSSVTLFAVDLYKPFLGKRLSEETVIRHSKRAGVVLVFLTMFFAPFLMHFQDGIFSYMVKTEILFGSPIFLILLIGYFSTKVSAKAANITLISYLVSLTLFQHVLTIDLHFLHILSILFVLHAGLGFLLARVFPSTREIKLPAAAKDIDLTPWKYFPHISVVAMITMVATYVVLSPWGLVKDAADKQINYWFIAAGLAMCVVIFGIPIRIFLRSRSLEKAQKLASD